MGSHHWLICVLVALGRCEKIVVAFLLGGHTHTDVDRIISYVVTNLRVWDIPTLRKVKAACSQLFPSQGKISKLPDGIKPLTFH